MSRSSRRVLRVPAAAGPDPVAAGQGYTLSAQSANGTMETIARGRGPAAGPAGRSGRPAAKARGQRSGGGAEALEATSNSWAVCGVLSGRCGLLKVSNPLKTKAIAQASVKTDQVDANVPAQLLRCDYLPGVWVPNDSTRRLRQAVARRTAL